MGRVDDQSIDERSKIMAVIKIQAFQKIEANTLDLGLDKRIVVIALQVRIHELLDGVAGLFEVVAGPIAQGADAASGIRRCVCIFSRYALATQVARTMSLKFCALVRGAGASYG